MNLLSEEPPPYRPLGPVAPQAAVPDPQNRSQPGVPLSPDSTLPGESGPRDDPDSSPVAHRLWGSQAVGEERSSLFPLRVIGGPDQPVFQYWPFSASDLYNWKTHNPPFSENPVALTGLIESILLTHQPSWDDCQQLLQALLTSEE